MESRVEMCLTSSGCSESLPASGHVHRSAATSRAHQGFFLLRPAVSPLSLRASLSLPPFFFPLVCVFVYFSDSKHFSRFPHSRLGPVNQL